MVEHLPPKEKAAGSSPVLGFWSRLIFFLFENMFLIHKLKNADNLLMQENL